MKKPILIHNPRCSKSRGAKEILESAGIDFETIDYLKDGLKEKLLTHLPVLLGLSYPEMIRNKEEIYKELKLAGKSLTDKEWVTILIKHPVLLERPIFIFNNKAVIARPPELVKTIL
jgi:arsenate reductase